MAMPSSEGDEHRGVDAIVVLLRRDVVLALEGRAPDRTRRREKGVSLRRALFSCRLVNVGHSELVFSTFTPTWAVPPGTRICRTS